MKKLPPSCGTSLYKPLFGVPQGGFTYYWRFIELFLPAKLSRVLESCIFNYSFLSGFLFQIQYSSCSRKMFHLLISSSHKRLLCLPMSPCFPLRLSKKWGATVKIIFMIIFRSLYLQFIFQKMVCVTFFIIFQILPNLKEKQRYKLFCYRFFSMLLSTFLALVVVELVRYKPVKGWWWSYENMKIIYVNCGLKNYMK